MELNESLFIAACAAFGLLLGLCLKRKDGRGPEALGPQDLIDDSQKSSGQGFAEPRSVPSRTRRKKRRPGFRWLALAALFLLISALSQQLWHEDAQDKESVPVSKVKAPGPESGTASPKTAGRPQENTPAHREESKAAPRAEDRQEDAQALYSRGLMYLEGKRVPRDYQKAADWIGKAAEAGHPEAQHDLGLMYYKGRGVELDYQKACEWFAKAAEAGHATARYNMGVMYENGYGVPKDMARAAEWYQEAAAQGHAKAQFTLGMMRFSGRGLEQDFAKSAEWFKKAAAQGHVKAQYNLGLMYAKGQGVPRDYRQACAWWEKAAEQKHAAAQYSLGWMHENGQGVPQSLPAAREWYGKACKNGYQKGCEALNTLNGQGI